MAAARHGRPLVNTARTTRAQSGRRLHCGDRRCLRCRDRVVPSGNTQPESGTLFVCFTCVDELRRPGDRGWQRLRNRLAVAAYSELNQALM